MKFRVVTVVYLLVCLVAVSVMPSAHAESTEDSSPGWESVSNNELYRVVVRPERGKPVVGKMHRWIIEVLTTDGEPVYPAQISIGGGMQGHGHGLPTQPQVIAYGGDGVYLIDGMRFNMEGEWQLSFVIASDYGRDRVDFDILLEF